MQLKKVFLRLLIICTSIFYIPHITSDPKTKTFLSIGVLNTVLTRYLEVINSAFIRENLRVGGKTVLMGDLEVRGNLSTPNSTSGGGLTGPTTATPNAVPRFANSSGQALINSSVLIDDSGNVTLNGITKNNNTVSWPSTAGAAGTFLGSDGAGNLVYSTPAGAGDVSATSPFSITNAVIRTDLTNGTRNIQESGVTIDDTGNMSVSGQLNILTQHPLRLHDNSGGDYIGLVAPATVPSSYTLTWPSTAPTASQFLRANAITPTNLEWISGGGSVTPSTSRLVYVTKYGNDSTGDGSFTTPYASLAKAIDTANSIATINNPVVITVAPGIYTENNSTGPLVITANGISITGSSTTGTVIIPNTLSQNLLSLTVSTRCANISFDAVSGSSATGIDIAGTNNNSSFSNIKCANFATGVSCDGTNGTYIFQDCLFRTNTVNIAVNAAVLLCDTCIFQGSLTTTPANTGVTVTGTGAFVSLGDCTFTRFNTGATFNDNSKSNIRACNFRNNVNDITLTGGSSSQVSGCSFQLNSTGGIDIDASGAGTEIEIVASYFDGNNITGTPQGTGLKITDSAIGTAVGTQFEHYVTGILLGTSGDTSSTQALISNSNIFDCTTDITQNGTTTLNVSAGIASSSQISINDPTNVQLAFFDPENNNALKIGSLSNTTEINLLRAAIAATNSPRINYLSNLYSTEAIGLKNPQNSDSSWYAISDSGNNINFTGITTSRAKTATVRLMSDTASPIGGTTALRGWDIGKKATSAELSFDYQNSDTTGQAAVANHTVVQFDGVNNQLQLPTAATQIVFTGDTNLYRSAADTLKTDDNLIIGGLTASRAVATDSNKQLVSSTATATELGYLSGVTSAIQTQLNTKLSTTGGTLTGTLQLPAGTTGAPSLVFTGSTTTGLSATSDNLSISTGATERFKVSSAGTVSINGFTSAGVVHNDASGNLSSSLIVNGDIDNTANISDTKLATISTAGKVANSATTATSSNTASAIVARDASGNFTAGTITANLTGSVTGAASLNVLKAGDTMTGALTVPAGTAASPTLKFSGSTNTGLSAQTADTLVLGTSGTTRLSISPAGAVTIADLAGTGVVHAISGLLSNSLIVNNDITNSTISNSKLATISSSNTSGNIVVRDGSGNFAANMITLTGTVTNNTDAATKAYVDSAVATGITAKTPALVVSTTNITISGTQTIDGVALVATDRVLLVGQTDPIENGLWVVQVGAWTRPADFASGSTAGQAYVLITSGNTQAGSSWLCNTPTAVIDTDPIEFAQFSIPGQTTATNVGTGAGEIFRNKTGITLNLKTIAAGTHISVTNNADDITLATDATNNNTASTIVARDGSGNFSAGTITAALIGAASLNVLKSGDSMTGTLNMLTQNAIRFQDAAGGDYIGFVAPTTVPSSYTLTWPAATPTANQFLRATATTPTTLEWVTGSGAVTPTTGKTIYVTKFGNDSTGDGSFTSPYASLKQAASLANTLSSTSNPITILISSGIYTEDNSTGSIAFTAGGISVVGASASGVFIYPNTLSQDLISTTAGVRFVNITFDANGVSTATGLNFSGTGNTSNGNNLRVFNFQTGMNCAGTFGAYLFDESTFRTNGTGIVCNNSTVILNNSTLSGSLTNTPANTGMSITGASGIVFFTGGLCTRLVNAITADTNAQLVLHSTIFRRCTNDIVAATAAQVQAMSASFQINNTGGIDIQADGAGTIVDIVGCFFNGKDGSGVAQGTAVKTTGGAATNITGSEIEYFITGIQAGDVADTSSTSTTLSGTSILNSTTDIVQNGTATLNFNTGAASSAKITINDSTNVKLAYFDPADDNTLKIGALTNSTEISLLRALIAQTNSPRINYLSNLYSTEAIGFRNPQNSDSSWYAISDSGNNINFTGITTNRAKTATVRLMSDTASPIGGTTALRGWDIGKKATSAELSFDYQNSDTTGQAAVANHTVVQFDGVNNQLQLPTAATQIVFTGDTNLYRSAADTLKTDDNLIIGGLTASRAVATDSNKQLVSSTATATELGYLSGVTSAIQTQLNTKLSTTGGTLTGTLQLPAGTTGAPSLVFTGSTTTGLSATSDNLSISTGATERFKVSSAGTVSINGFTSAGVVHNDASGNLSSSLIVNGDIDNTANISDTKLATISTAGKVANSATTATSSNTASAIVARDASGNFTAGTITANLTGSVTGAASLNVLKAGDTMTGALTVPAGTSASPTLKFSGSTNTGLSAQTSNTISFSTNSSERLNIGAGGLITINGLNSTGVVHTDTNGVLSTSFIVNADVDAAAAIVDTKLATISTAGKVANSATTATSANTASAIVARDGSGNFSAGTITANLTGSVTGAASLNVLKSGDTMTGTLTHPAGSAATPAIQFTGSTNTGISAATANTLSFDTNGTERMSISTTDITLSTRTLFSTITCNQAIQTASPTNNSTVTTNSTTGVLIFQHPANRTNVTINFPPSPTNGQLFTMLLGTTSSITLNLAGGTGGASIVNGITTLNTNAPGATTGGPTATYIYLSSANTWYLYGR